MKMKLNWAAGILAPIILLAIFLIGKVTIAPQTVSNSNSYTDPNHTFTIEYPKDQVKVVTSKDEINSSGYIPACDPDTTVVCFVYASSTFPGTNFSSAGVAVGVLADKKNEEDCLTQFNEMGSAGMRDINGVSFQGFKFGEGAAGHHTTGYDYRTFHNGKCYQLTTRLNTTAFENYQAGTIKEFTADNEIQITGAMDKIVSTFRFN